MKSRLLGLVNLYKSIDIQIMMKKGLIIFVVAATAAFVALFALYRPIHATHPSLINAQLPELIPLNRFFGNSSARWNFKMSPDGKRLAWLESKYLRPALWVRSLDSDTAEIFHTDDEVRSYNWSADGRYLIYQADRDGWENDVIVSIDTHAADAAPRSYDFGVDVKSWIVHVPANAGSNIIIVHNARDRSLFDLYELDLQSGNSVELAKADGTPTHWHHSNIGKLYARTQFDRNSQWSFQLQKADGTYGELFKGGLEDRFIALAPPDENNDLLAISNLGRDKSALMKINVDSKQQTIIHAHDEVDYGWINLHPKTNALLYGRNFPDYPQYKWFDKQLGASLDSLRKEKHANISVRSTTQDLSKILVDVHEDITASRTVLLDRTNNTSRVVNQAKIAEFKNAMSPVEPVFITATDGLRIPAFLSRPKGVTGPAPMIMFIHGGPVHRSFWGYTDLRALFTNRGYVVLDVNYRMSDGYGRKFREAGIGEISRKAHQDIVDARQWAVDNGIADPNKVGVFGGSFGGLKTLTALAFTPDLFAAGVDINGISDLVSMYSEVPVYWRGWPAWYRKYIGDPTTPEGLKDIQSRSPLSLADKIKSPLLIIQGANDVRVIRNQSDKIVQAMRKANIPVEYDLVEGQGHQMRNWGWQQRMLTMRRIERFFATHLGGRADGFDYVVVGAKIIP